jgi:hypothetical protein
MKTSIKKRPPKKHDLDGVLTSKQAAAYLQITEAVLISEAEAFRLPGRKFGNEWRFLRSALDRSLSEPLESSRDRFLKFAGMWADDPSADDLIERIEKNRKSN